MWTTQCVVLILAKKIPNRRGGWFGIKILVERIATACRNNDGKEVAIKICEKTRDSVRDTAKS
jgi:hypothetical protein